MLKNINQSLRVLFRYPLYTGFALIGLSIAVTSAWFITDYTMESYSYDRFHSKYDRIYRLSMEISAGGTTDHYATTGKPLGEYVTKNYVGVEAYAKLKFQEAIVDLNKEVYKESGFFQANPNILSVFTFEFLHGGITSLSKPNSIVLSKSLAKKYFQGTDVIGNQFVVNNQNYNVTGVFEDWPESSHLEVNALLFLEEDSDYELQSWFDIEQYTYVLVDNITHLEDLNKKLDHLANEHLLPMIEGSGLDVSFKAQPLKEVYFSPGLVDDIKKGSLTYANLMMVSGILVLLIASLNFINLILTRSTHRSKEILLKKILGISRKQLFLQSSKESFLMGLLVILFSALIIVLGDGLYLDNTGFSSLDSNRSLFYIPILFMLIFTLGLLGSSYSGVYLSFSNNSLLQEGLKVNIFKKVLLSFQYGIAAVILIITLAMERQLDFIEKRDLGFDQEGVLILTLPENETVSDRSILFRDHLRDLTSVENASLIGGGALPGEQNGKDLFEVDVAGVKTEKVYNIYRVDEWYFDLLDIGIVKGRNFNADKLSDVSGSVIINETLVNSLNWDEPIGKKIWYGGELREVIGVAGNFHNKSLHNIIEPIVFVYDTNLANKVLIKTRSKGNNIFKSAWISFYPEAPYSVSYFDQFIEKMYESEHHLTQLFGFFSIVALILCAMGLFALFSLHVLQKTKEMSICKVLGANYSNLFNSITKQYSALTTVSILAAMPFSWIIVKKWLSDFSYQVSIGAEVYFISGFILLAGSFAVIAYHLLKVLNINPVKALKE